MSGPAPLAAHPAPHPPLSLGLFDRWAASRIRWLLAPLLGALAACGFAPLGLWPLTLFGLAGLLALVHAARGWRARALLGWLWGVGHFSVGNAWIATAFTYQAKMPAWLGGIAVVLLALYLALWPMAAALVARAIGRGDPLRTVFAFGGAWIVSEWGRGWAFTGFPWNPVAAVTLGPDSRPGLAMVAALTGTYALSGLVVLLAGCWFAALVSRRRPAWRAALVLAPVLAFVAPLAWVPAPEPGPLDIVLVQPGIAQSELEEPSLFEAHFQRAAALSRDADPASPRPRLVLWPESGVPDYLRDGYPPELYFWGTYAADPRLARLRLGRVAGPRSLLLTGTTDLAIAHGQLLGARNVVSVIDPGGAIVGSYAKAHLVPYGEYLPLRDWLEPLGLARLVPGAFDLLPGPGPRTLDLGRFGKAGIQICYEIVFSGEVVDPRLRPDYLVAPTNDGWFGPSGPPQHLAQARLRAIEEGLPVLRATVSGISAVIDANGAVRAAIPRGASARVAMAAPRAHAPTPFSRGGNTAALGIAMILLGIAHVAKRQRAM